MVQFHTILSMAAKKGLIRKEDDELMSLKLK